MWQHSANFILNYKRQIEVSKEKYLTPIERKRAKNGSALASMELEHSITIRKVQNSHDSAGPHSVAAADTKNHDPKIHALQQKIARYDELIKEIKEIAHNAIDKLNSIAEVHHDKFNELYAAADVRMFRDNKTRDAFVGHQINLCKLNGNNFWIAVGHADYKMMVAANQAADSRPFEAFIDRKIEFDDIDIGKHMDHLLSNELTGLSHEMWKDMYRCPTLLNAAQKRKLYTATVFEMCGLYEIEAQMAKDRFDEILGAFEEKHDSLANELGTTNIGASLILLEDQIDGFEMRKLREYISGCSATEEKKLWESYGKRSDLNATLFLKSLSDEYKDMVHGLQSAVDTVVEVTHMVQYELRAYQV